VRECGSSSPPIGGAILLPHSCAFPADAGLRIQYSRRTYAKQEREGTVSDIIDPEIASLLEALAGGKSPLEWLNDQIAKMPPRSEPTLADRLHRLGDLQAMIAGARVHREKLLAVSDAELSASGRADMDRLLAHVELEIRSIHLSIFDLGIERRACGVRSESIKQRRR
jgi:hypothetical protein